MAVDARKAEWFLGGSGLVGDVLGGGMMQCDVSTGRRVHHPPQTGPAVVEGAGQTRVRPKISSQQNLQLTLCFQTYDAY